MCIRSETPVSKERLGTGEVPGRTKGRSIAVGWILPGLWALLLAGCATHRHQRLATAVEQDHLAMAPLSAQVFARQRPLRVALYAPRRGPPGALPEPEVIARLVRLLLGPGDLEVAVLPAWMGQRPPRELLPYAARERYDALVALEVASGDIRFEGYHWSAWPNLLLWAGSGYPSHWAHDCRYVGEVQLKLRVWDVQQANPVRAWSPAPGRHEEKLNYHERTRGIWPYLVANVCPPICYPDNPEALRRALLRPMLVGPAGELYLTLRALPYGRWRLMLTRELSPGHEITELALKDGWLLPKSGLDRLRCGFKVHGDGAFAKNLLLNGKIIWTAKTPEEKACSAELKNQDLRGEGALIELIDTLDQRSQIRLRAVIHEAPELGPAPEPAIKSAR